MYPDIKKLFLKGPFYLGENEMYRLLEKTPQKKNQIIITSPSVVLSTHSIDRHYLMVNIDHLKSTGSCVCLYQYILNLEKNLSNNKTLVNNKKLLSVIHSWNGNKYLRFSLGIDNIRIYDADKKSIELTDIKKGSLIKVMFWLKGLVINKNTFSLQLEIIQIRMFDILPPTECLITLDDIPEQRNSNNNLNNTISNEDSPENNGDKNDGIPLKYKKMLNMGIPIGSVKQKCILDGVDPNILTPGVKVKAPCSNNPLYRHPMGLVNLLGGLTSVKLNRVTDNDRIKTPIKKKSSDNMLVPSLEDILSIKSQLKSIK